MNGSRGRVYFHKLFSLGSLGLKDSGLFVDRIISEFLRIGEAVAGRWIQMPHGILILQMVPGQADSGAIYLYDRDQQVFYLVGFDGPEDNLTVEEFEQVMAEYGLLRFAEQPSLARAVPIPQPPAEHGRVPVEKSVTTLPGGLRLAARNCRSFPSKQGVRWYARPGIVHFSFQGCGSA